MKPLNRIDSNCFTVIRKILNYKFSVCVSSSAPPFRFFAFRYETLSTKLVQYFAYQAICCPIWYSVNVN